jgi:trans-2-enoyl-CoA reductase
MLSRVLLWDGQHVLRQRPRSRILFSVFVLVVPPAISHSPIRRIRFTPSFLFTFLFFPPCRLDSVSLDTAALRKGDILVRILAAPLTPGDFSAIAGYAGKAPAFPRVAGNEGVGVVEHVGSGVSGIAVGDVVVASRAGAGTWATHSVSDASLWTSVSGGGVISSTSISSFPVEVAAVAVGAPLTARHILKAGGVAAGDVVIQNAASSLVGQAIVQYAASAGAKTVNIMPQVDNFDNLSHHLQGLGAGPVVSDAFARTPAFRKLLADFTASKLGVSGAGGASASSVASALGANAALVSYGGSEREAIRVSQSALIRQGLRISGFNLDATLASLTKDARDAAVREAFDHVKGGADAKVKLLVAREAFATDFATALKRSFTRGERTIVLTM